MGGSRLEIRLPDNLGSLLLLCVTVLAVPATWILAWVFSVAIHEMGHLLMIRLMGISVYFIRFSVFGARIGTGPMGPWQELLCAAAGPLAGIVLILCGRWFPLSAFFSFFHTVWNLLPFGDHDGARILGSLWELVRKIPCKPGQERIQ